MEFTYSVIIPTYNEIRDLEVTVAMVWASEPRPHEIIVVDDCSNKPVSERLSSFTGVKVVRTPEQLGAGPAKRFGAEKATGDIIVLLDSHMRMPLNWLQQADDAIDRHPNSIFCCACRSFTGSFVGCGAKFDRRNTMEEIDLFLGRTWLDRGDIDTIDRCPCLLGACYFIPRMIWDYLHGIHPQFKGWGYGEQDLSLRAWMSGFEVRRINGLCLPHRFASELKEEQRGNLIEEQRGTFHGWGNAYNIMVLAATVFEDGVFDRLYRPYFKQVLPRESVIRFEDSIRKIDRFRTIVQRTRLYSDDELHALCGFRLPTPAEQQATVDEILTIKADKNKERRQINRRKKCNCEEEEKSVDVTRNGVKFKVVATCKEGSEWWETKYNGWEKETFEFFDRLITKNMTYIDLGTFTGHTILYVAQKAKEVYGVELDPEAYVACNKNILANNYTNVVLEHVAIFDTNGTVSISDKHIGNSNCRISSTGSLVPSMTIESLMDKWKIDRCDFLKMDIEGSEEICLPAMTNFFEKYKPIVHLSIHKHYGATAKTVVNTVGEIYKYAYDNNFNEVNGSLLEAIENGPSGFGNEYVFTNEKIKKKHKRNKIKMTVST